MVDLSNYTNPFTLKSRLCRILFNVVWAVFVKPFPVRITRRWNIIVLRAFGAKVHSTCTIYSSAKIMMPWNLVMHDYSCIANNVIIENASIVSLGSHSIVSQYSYLCTASHDIRSIGFKHVSHPITIQSMAWVCASCFVGSGVCIGTGAVVGASSSIFKNVEPWSIVGGNPAKQLGIRKVLEAHVS